MSYIESTTGVSNFHARGTLAGLAASSTKEIDWQSVQISYRITGADLATSGSDVRVQLDNNNIFQLIPNLRGGLTTVHLDKSKNTVRIVGSSAADERFKESLIFLERGEDIANIPWIDFPQLQSVWDELSEEIKSGILANIDYGRNFLQRGIGPRVASNDAAALGISRGREDPQRWHDWLEQYSELMSDRRVVFGFLCSLRFPHFIDVLDELSIPIHGSLRRLAVDRIGELKREDHFAVVRGLRTIWDRQSLEERHGSLDTYLYATLIPIRFYTREHVARLSADSYLRDTDGLVSLSQLGSSFVEDAARFQLIAKSTHLRYFSTHGREQYTSIVDGAPTFGYSDLEAIRICFPRFLKSFVEKPRQSARIELIDLAAISSALDPLIYLDAPQVRQDMLKRCRADVGDDKVREVFRKILDCTWDDLQKPWLMHNVFLERANSPLRQCIDNDSPLDSLVLWSSSDAPRDLLSYYLCPTAEPEVVTPFHVQTPDGIKKSITGADRERQFFDALKADL